MPKLVNPTDFDLTSYPAGLVVPAHGSIDVDDDVAEQHKDGPIFQVGAGAAKEQEKVAKEQEKENENPGAVAERGLTTRGGKQAEESKTPARETRKS